jgi:hypothetical protein
MGELSSAVEVIEIRERRRGWVSTQKSFLQSGGGFMQLGHSLSAPVKQAGFNVLILTMMSSDEGPGYCRPTESENSKFL